MTHALPVQGTRIVCRLRHELFKSLLKQEVAFFDQNQVRGLIVHDLVVVYFCVYVCGIV